MGNHEQTEHVQSKSILANYLYECCKTTRCVEKHSPPDRPAPGQHGSYIPNLAPRTHVLARMPRCNYPCTWGAR